MINSLSFSWPRNRRLSSTTGLYVAWPRGRRIQRSGTLSRGNCRARILPWQLSYRIMRLCLQMPRNRWSSVAPQYHTSMAGDGAVFPPRTPVETIASLSKRRFWAASDLYGLLQWRAFGLVIGNAHTDLPLIIFYLLLLNLDSFQATFFLFVLWMKLKIILRFLDLVYIVWPVLLSHAIFLYIVISLDREEKINR